MRAPPFTAQNAAEMALRSVAARQARIERERTEAEAAKQAARLAPDPNSDEARKRRVQCQIDLLLSDMESAKSVEKRLQIGSAIERLWKLVQPTAGVLRPSKQSRSRQPDIQPISPTPIQSSNEPNG
jgi:hypothetical protein